MNPNPGNAIMLDADYTRARFAMGIDWRWRCIGMGRWLDPKGRLVKLAAAQPLLAGVEPGMSIYLGSRWFEHEASTHAADLIFHGRLVIADPHTGNPLCLNDLPSRFTRKIASAETQAKSSVKYHGTYYPPRRKPNTAQRSA